MIIVIIKLWLHIIQLCIFLILCLILAIIWFSFQKFKRAIDYHIDLEVQVTMPVENFVWL